ncbi:uncharacterized protein LOC111050182 [Nilaparvata lugens]|uniref:uncharacterized protein LOC111050182 n=1 Tax=Nilaparvata lugens TaxID=108931 RepID=UPI00193D00F4|nr:uncharacterized protein LOC111050182 [Nilaparvata lugens]
MSVMTNVVFVVVLVSAQASQVIYVDKCCPLEERLSNKLECSPAKTTTDNDWLAGELSVVSGDLPIALYDDSRSRCQDVDFTLLSEDFSLLQDGSLHVVQDMQNVTLPGGSFCIDRMQDYDAIVILVCPCANNVCVQKCCHHPYVLHISTNGNYANCQQPTQQTVEWSLQFWKYQSVNNRPLYEMHGYPSCEVEAAQYIVEKRRRSWNEMHELRITSEGGLQFADLGYFAPRSFCADIAIWSNSDFNPDSQSNSDFNIQTPNPNPGFSMNVIACRFHLKPTARQKVYGVLYIIGTIALMLTVLVHLVFPQLRKTAQAYIMIAYCSSLVLAYTSNALIIFAGVKIQGTVYCRLLGLTIQGGFLAAFFWLNAMCIDIAATFRGLHLLKNHGKIRKGKKFVVYCFYVYGITAVIIGLTIVCQHFLSEAPSPNFNNENCWFNDVTTSTIFFFLPLGISQSINIVLFISTAVKIYKAQRQTAILSRDGSGRHTGKKPYSSQDKRRFFLFVKLFFLMGLTWTFEVISATFHEQNRLWYITDTINMLSGVIIFAMFCCKRKVVKLFLNTIKCSKKTESNSSSQRVTVSPKISYSYSTRSTSINVYNIESAYRNEVSMTSSPNCTMSYL